MIVFDLGCGNHHRFEGWFDSGEDYERQLGQRLLACPLCGNADVARVPHAAHIKAAGKERPARPDAATPVPQQYANISGEVLTKVIEHIISNTEDVGAAFPEEARKIHYHEVPERRIRGTASRDEVDSMRDEGIEVVSLPVPAHRLGKPH
jgi:hypothetical protein